MKLSVIIPVYRVEATLDRCLQSVLSQQLPDQEVILVDDGSPDRCPQLCDDWAARDARVRVIHQPNGGLSDARNRGLDAATGQIVTFVDSDDWLAPDTYQPLLPLMADTDLLEYSIAGRLVLPDRVYDRMDDYWLQGQAYCHTYACNKLYRRKLFDDVRFPVGKVFEDAYTLPRLLRHARRVMTTSRGSYYYTQNPRGITATADGEALASLLDAHLMSGMPMDDLYYLHLLNIQLDVCRLTGRPPQLPPRHVALVGNIKMKLKAIALNTFGINTLCTIDKIAKRFSSH